MSRIGRRPVTLPDNVKCISVDSRLLVEGPLGKLDLSLPNGIEVVVEDGVANVKAPSQKTRQNRGFQGLARALLANMVEGETKGYEKNLEISGVGYRCEQRGTQLTFSLGYSHTITLTVPDGIVAEVDKNQTKVKIKGVDKQLVGQVAANITRLRKPDSYKGKGVRYKGQVMSLKQGKSVKK